MKYVIVVAAGLADEAQDSLGGVSPLAAARTPNLNSLAAEGRVGLVRTVPEGEAPDPVDALLAILGYDPRRFDTRRGGFEAIGAGLDMDSDEWAFRCDFVTLDNDTIADFSAGHIGTAEAEALMESLVAKLDRQEIRFSRCRGYRAAMAIKPRGPFKVSCRPPIEILGQDIGECGPEGNGSELLQHVIRTSRDVFADHEINRLRLDLDESPASMVWPWGEGQKPALPSFRERHEIDGAVVCASGYVRGIAESIGWRCVEVEGATGYFDTCYAAKASAVLDALETADIVLVHVESPAEASLQGDVPRKVKCIEDLDKDVVGPLRTWVEASDDRRAMVLPDCALHASSQQYGSEPVPFVMSKQQVTPARSVAFTESAVVSSALQVEEGHQLLQYFLRG